MINFGKLLNPLPQEIVWNILLFCEFKQLLSLSLTNSTYNKAIMKKNRVFKLLLKNSHKRDYDIIKKIDGYQYRNYFLYDILSEKNFQKIQELKWEKGKDEFVSNKELKVYNVPLKYENGPAAVRWNGPDHIESIQLTKTRFYVLYKEYKCHVFKCTSFDEREMEIDFRKILPDTFLHTLGYYARTHFFVSDDEKRFVCYHPYSQMAVILGRDDPNNNEVEVVKFFDRSPGPQFNMVKGRFFYYNVPKKEGIIYDINSNVFFDISKYKTLKKAKILHFDVSFEKNKLFLVTSKVGNVYEISLTTGRILKTHVINDKYLRFRWYFKHFLFRGCESFILLECNRDFFTVVNRNYTRDQIVTNERRQMHPSPTKFLYYGLGKKLGENGIIVEIEPLILGGRFVIERRESYFVVTEPTKPCQSSFDDNRYMKKEYNVFKYIGKKYKCLFQMPNYVQTKHSLVIFKKGKLILRNGHFKHFVTGLIQFDDDDIFNLKF